MRHRLIHAALAVGIAVMATVFAGPGSSASAAPITAPNLCTTKEFANPANWQKCIDAMHDVAVEQLNCVQAPTPQTPSAGLAGWFASKPASYGKTGIPGLYTDYGYAGYEFTTYDIGCVKTVMHPDYKFENTVANGEMMIASAILGASNAVREKAWDPSTMYGWADPLIEKLTRVLYDRVFRGLGVFTLAVVGIYLLWRARQADLSHAVTVSAWAVFVTVLVTAIAHWPVYSANVADGALTGSLASVHSALSGTRPTAQCWNPDPAACVDNRTPAQVTTDAVTQGMLFRNWVRGTFGDADSDTAKKYGALMYESKAFTWDEAQDIKKDPAQRKLLIDEKQRSWNKTAAQIKAEDPGAYENLQGLNSMDRIGAGFIAIITSLAFAVFDIAASILVLVGFLIFRWAVIALPIIGTFALFRPASAGLMRMRDLVIGSVLNILIFGAGAAIYVLLVDVILSTTNLPGWVQFLLILLVGGVGWFVLKPYRRIRYLGGRDPVRFAGNAAIEGARIGQEIDKRVAAALKTAGRTP
jgi:hypothetical protein